ncbi:MAG: HD-GYP domain-containing protein [Lachnospiraceae bacterium]|nr:HD-GYP domain-containing protein [Lachnospiraceae bacterium]
MEMKLILTEEAVPGMIVAQDVYGLNDYLIIPGGSELTNHSITRLKFYAISQIYIEVNEDGEPEQRENMENIISDSYAEYIKKTPEFKKFKDAYQAITSDMKEMISVIGGKLSQPIHSEKLLKSMGSVLEETRNGTHILHMLHCMRDSDDVTYTHSVNVALFCNAFGHWLKMSQEDIKVLTLCGLLHDIGKLLVPSAIISKASKLTTMEFDLIKNHPQDGYLLLETQDLDERVKQSALMHHERIDGSGYPKGLKGDQIDEFSQIVAIADIYVAMISPRVYRRPNCPFEAMSIFEQEGYKKFNTKYLLTFLEGMANTYINCTVRLNDDRVGEIVMIDSNNITRPVVKVDNEFIDLKKEKDLFIQELI